MNHFCKTISNKTQGFKFDQVSSASESDSEESSGRIVIVKLNSSNIQAKLVAQGLFRDGTKYDL